MIQTKIKSVLTKAFTMIKMSKGHFTLLLFSKLSVLSLTYSTCHVHHYMYPLFSAVFIFTRPQSNSEEGKYYESKLQSFVFSAFEHKFPSVL